MARISDNVLSQGVTLSLSLDRYQEVMGLPIAAFNGLLKDNEDVQYSCPNIWKQRERDFLAIYLASAEERRERELGFFLGPKYLTGEFFSNLSNPIILKHKYLIQVGTEVMDLLVDDAVLTLRDISSGLIYDPVTLLVTTTVTDPGEIMITYPDSTTPIHPSKVTIIGGVASIEIPRSRLVDPIFDDNREDPLSYDDDSNFLGNVDVYRHYTDITQGVQYFHTLTDFSEVITYGYAKLLESKLSIVSCTPATWSGLTASSVCMDCGHHNLRMAYLSGRRYSMTTEIQTCRFAHTLMPHEPCTCDAGHMYWINDMEDTKNWSPYGRAVGALDAWLQDSRDRVGVGGMFR